MPNLIGEKKVDIQILSEDWSTSGKYKIFYGVHFAKIAGGVQSCWDVGSINTVSGEVTRRHYEYKDQAIAYWDEFRNKMTEEPEYEDEDGASALPN